MNITPQILIEETYNYYGKKASLPMAVEFIDQFGCATPGRFFDWICNQDK